MFQLSPSVNVREKELTVSFPAIATSIVGMVGDFEWGQCGVRVPVTAEKNLLELFGYPTDDNYEHWFSAANVLAYTNMLYVVRAVDQAVAKNAGVRFMDSAAGVTTATAYSILKLNDDHEITVPFTGDEKLTFLAKYAGVRGNRIEVAICNATDFDSANITTGVSFKSQFEFTPEVDEVCVAILFDGVIVEKFTCSLTVGTKDYQGLNNYIEDKINKRSAYVWCYDDVANTDGVFSYQATALTGGVDGTPATSDITLAYDLFGNAEEIDVNTVIDGGNVNATIQGYIKSNITELRKDVIGVLNTSKDSVVGATSVSVAVTDINTYRDSLGDSSYCKFIGNWKYQYDKYNDKYRWLPLSGDIAGLMALTDYESEPWMACAGYDNLIKNVERFAINPDLGYRNLLYKNAVNPVIWDKTDGPVLLGNKMMVSKPSLFGRYDVRKLFIILEKTIATAAKYYMFKKNNAFTRRRFKSSVEVFLRKVQGGEGIDDFVVVCDETNNDATVLDQYGFVGDFYIKPTNSSEFLQLNFNAVNHSVDFKEVIGTQP